MKSTSEEQLVFNKTLFPFRYFDPKDIDAQLFYRFCIAAYALTAAASLLALVILLTKSGSEADLVQSSLSLLPSLVIAGITPLLITATLGFFRRIDYRQYLPFRWNPDRRLHKRAAVVWASLKGLAICSAIIAFPQGLFLLLIEEYHVLSFTYPVWMAYVAIIAYLIPLVATSLFICITALITEFLKALANH